MTTALEKPTLPTIQLYAQSLAPQERSKHRFWIGLRVEALMEPYWQTRPAEAVKEMIVADWLAALENYAPEEITAACRAYWNGPDRARKPKPGDIRALMDMARFLAMDAERFRAKPSDTIPDDAPRRAPPTPEKASAIVAEIYGKDLGQ